MNWLIMNIRKKKCGTKKNAAYTEDMIKATTTLLIEKSHYMAERAQQRWSWQLFTQFWILPIDFGARTSDMTYVQWKHIKTRSYDPRNPLSGQEVINEVYNPKSKTGSRDRIVK